MEEPEVELWGEGTRLADGLTVYRNNYDGSLELVIKDIIGFRSIVLSENQVKELMKWLSEVR